jgi:hypothetical protein
MDRSSKRSPEESHVTIPQEMRPRERWKESRNPEKTTQTIISIPNTRAE